MLLPGITIFLSAFLLFLIQPILARMILPWFGGSAAVWTTCLMFFQLTLLAGYAYAHASIRFLRPRTQTIVHLALLALSLALLPVIPAASWKPAGVFNPALRIVELLTATAAIPYLLLSTTSPLLQAWFARRHSGASPYRLYALSNAGSLLALLSYPSLIEPSLFLRIQGYVWSAGYVVFVCLTGWIAWVSREGTAATAPIGDVHVDAPTAGRRLVWVALAFCPSLLLLAVTSHMTQNVSPVPLLWVIPLALYLVSFILTFDSPRWYGRRVWLPLFVFAVAVMLAFLFPQDRNAGLRFVIPVFTLGFFICAVVCHGELYRLRPPSKWLTSFYLSISIGGALGGLFVGVAAPYLFHDYLELPIGLLITVLLLAAVLHHDVPSLPGPVARYLEYALLTALTGGFVYLLAWEYPHWASQYKLMTRNFYGAVRVMDIAETDETEPMRRLQHGTIDHGSEFLNPRFHRKPTTYYGPASGAGIALADRASQPARTVGIVGLGAGTLAAYARPGDTYRFYEINPEVVKIAESDFYFLRECPAKWDIVLGDARLSLEKEPPGMFDVLAIDAFSGDAIPIHLLTAEAIQQDFRNLKRDGILAIHVSNKFLRLGSVLARAGADLHKPAMLISNSDNDDAGIYGSDWVIMAADPHVLERPEWQVPQRTAMPAPTPTLWTDDYSNLLRIIK